MELTLKRLDIGEAKCGWGWGIAFGNVGRMNRRKDFGILLERGNEYGRK